MKMRHNIELDKKLKNAAKQLESLNCIISDLNIELETVRFVNIMSQFEVDMKLK